MAVINDNNTAIRHSRLLVSLMTLTCLGRHALAADATGTQANAIELPEVNVVATTPGSTSGLPLAKIAGNLQSAEDEDIERHGALDLSDFMKRDLGGVNINDSTNNPFQMDVNYRGFEASPLLGAPIGLSVYQDGVRVNEAFGDIVNWDLIPKSAIANIELVPGSNPLFGLNTLGGSLAVRTKSGFTHPGTRAEASGGSFGRAMVDFEHGGSRGQIDWFVTGNVLSEDGWRPYSGSDVRQLFGKVGWQNGTTDVDLSYTFADNSLNGVQATPESQLAINRSAIYTAPDTEDNGLHFVNLQVSHELGHEWTLSGNAYYRELDSSLLNSNTAGTCDTITLTSCLDNTGTPTGDAPASNQLTHTVSRATGTTGQVTNESKIAGRENQFIAGVSYDFGHTRYAISTQDATLGANFGTIPVNTLSMQTSLVAENQYLGLFGTDTLSVTPWLHLTGSARWTQARIDLADQLGTALNGHHLFDRLNPSAGVALSPLDALGIKTPLESFSLFFNYSEGFRAPSPLELSCAYDHSKAANAQTSCPLPNGFLGDPALKPVVAKTYEAGLRGALSERMAWSFAAFRSQLDNDILFIASSSTNGNFDNIGQSRRQGLEINLKGRLPRLDWYANYSLVDATYQSGATLANPVGAATVRPGDVIPGIPRHSLKVGVEYAVLPNWFVGGDLRYSSSQFIRGDDSNQLPKVGEYAVVNFDTRYKLSRHVELFGMIDNIFNSSYETFGVLNKNLFTGRIERFLGPAAPIAGWGGVRVTFE